MNSTTTHTDCFWIEKTLNEMTDSEWEQLCDGCGLCCLNKIIDKETDEICTTNVACDQLDKKTGACKHYENRFVYQPDCIKLTKENVSQIPWLPKTCAYYLVLHKQPLPAWHPLIMGNKDKLSEQMRVFRQRLVYEKDVICWEDHVIKSV